jgi:hypothetical protein
MCLRCDTSPCRVDADPFGVGSKRKTRNSTPDEILVIFLMHSTSSGLPHSHSVRKPTEPAMQDINKNRHARKCPRKEFQ